MEECTRRRVLMGAAVPALAPTTPTSAPNVAELSEFARALAAFHPIAAEYARIGKRVDEVSAAFRPLLQRKADAEAALKDARQASYRECSDKKWAAEERRLSEEKPKKSKKSKRFRMLSKEESEKLLAGIREAARKDIDDTKAAAESMPAVIAAKDNLAAATEAVQRYELAANDFWEEADAFASRFYDALDAVHLAAPGDLAEWLQKLEILAIHRPQSDIHFADMLDLAARDLWSLGIRSNLSDESARVPRGWYLFPDSPDFDADRSKASWRYVEGRGMVAEV